MPETKSSSILFKFFLTDFPRVRQVRRQSITIKGVSQLYISLLTFM
jgi:hypothetical protein